MNYLRRICCALVFLSLLSVPVVAGEVDGPGKKPGEVDVPGMTVSSTEPGEVPMPGRNKPGEQNTPGKREPGEIGTPGKNGALQIQIGLVLWLVSLVR